MARNLQPLKPTRQGSKLLALPKEVPQVLTKTFEDDGETACLYIQSFIGEICVDRTLVDTSAQHYTKLDHHIVRRFAVERV